MICPSASAPGRPSTTAFHAVEARWWERIVKELAIEVDETGSLLDATIVRAHQDAAGGKEGSDAIIWRSRGGFSTKIHAVTTTEGRPLYVALTPGQQHEATMAEELHRARHRRLCIADTGTVQLASWRRFEPAACDPS